MKIEGLLDICKDAEGKIYQLPDGSIVTLKKAFWKLLLDFRPNGRQITKDVEALVSRFEEAKGELELTAEEAQVLEVAANQNASGFPTLVMGRVWRAI